MRRKIVISLVICVVVAAIALTASRIEPVTIPYAAVTTDNSGGAIVLYPLYRVFSLRGPSAQFYVQRISSEGDFLLGGKGTLVGAGSWRGYELRALSDGSGGAIVMWVPWNRGPLSVQVHVAKIDSEGCVEWQRDIPGAEKAIPDGSGGVIVAFGDSDGNIAVLKIDAEGNLPWGEDGVSVGLWPERSDEMASDNSGGVIVVESTFQGSDTVYAQRVDSQGNILWQPGGVQAYTGPAEEAQVVSDGAGGAIIAYMRDIPCEDGVGFCDSDIYAQRIDAGGSVLWGPDGVPICTESAVVQNPQIVDDGAGGAIVFFVDERGVCAQRVDADGHKLWDEDVELRATPYYSLVSDGSGGGISVWYGGGGISAAAQRIDATGTELWGPGGTTLTFRDLYLPGAVSDGCGGVLISWSADVKFRDYEVSDVSYYVQRVDADGNVVWGDEGILLNP